MKLSSRVETEQVRLSVERAASDCAEPHSRGERLDAAREADRQWQEERNLEAQRHHAALVAEEESIARGCTRAVQATLGSLIGVIFLATFGNMVQGMGFDNDVVMAVLVALGLLGVVGVFFGLCFLVFGGIGYAAASTHRKAFEMLARRNAINLGSGEEDGTLPDCETVPE